MKAFNEVAEKQFQRAGLILLFDGEVGCRKRQPRRAQLNRYPDFGFNLAPAFPIPTSGSVALGVCIPLQWRNRPRFSRGSRSFSCNISDFKIRLFQRAASLLFLLSYIAKTNFCSFRS